MIEHVTDAEIEDFALGQLPPARVTGFEAHVSTCDDCAARLAREARLELQLREVHAARPRVAISRRTGAALATVALAAAVLIVVLTRPGLESTRAIPNVVCPDGPGQQACVQHAQRRGLFVQYPEWADAPPFGDGGWASGPSVAPYSLAVNHPGAER